MGMKSLLRNEGQRSFRSQDPDVAGFGFGAARCHLAVAKIAHREQWEGRHCASSCSMGFGCRPTGSGGRTGDLWGAVPGCGGEPRAEMPGSVPPSGLTQMAAAVRKEKRKHEALPASLGAGGRVAVSPRGPPFLPTRSPLLLQN